MNRWIEKNRERERERERERDGHIKIDAKMDIVNRPI